MQNSSTYRLQYDPFDGTWLIQRRNPVSQFEVEVEVVRENLASLSDAETALAEFLD